MNINVIQAVNLTMNEILCIFKVACFDCVNLLNEMGYLKMLRIKNPLSVLRYIQNHHNIYVQGFTILNLATILVNGG